MTEDFISVIVTTYNQEDTIGRTLDSILAQECSIPVEIVIGEDCSTDHTRDICHAYAEKFPEKIRLMCNEYNKGIIDNYFDCLLACRGKYIADCAGDDFWTDRHKLDKESALIKSNPEITLVHTDWRYYDEDTMQAYCSGMQKYDTTITDGSLMLEDIIIQTDRPVIHLCTALYRKDVFIEEYKKDKYMFRNKNFGCEDLQICFIMAMRGLIGYIPDETTNYSRGHNSVSYNTNERKQFRFVEQVSALSFYLSNKYSVKSQQTEAYFRRRIHELAMHAFRSKAVDMKETIYRHAEEWDVNPFVKTNIILSVMNNNIAYNAILHARRLFRYFKKCRLYLSTNNFFRS